ncbi:probable disease resistance protein At1g12290 [Impatiens glandulifera]|uniref:probable disease resistance protein At1g12290 n=1 Tax=Impatiens glandulifera TaxID=253017 RepID=UPI001FB157A4|nr:probable disease resistance protein At1g12290 [Impatiens glandulifera]
MAEKVALSVGGKIAEWLFEPIQRELGYLFCFNNNFQVLEAKLGELKATRIDVQGREDAEERMRKTLGESVKLWIKDADGKIVETESLINDKAELQKGCFSIKWCPNISLRFSLGRKGKKLSLLLVELLRRGGELPSEGYDLPVQPRSCWRKYNGDDLDFESRKKIKEDIVEKLLDEETMLIGICGMGGVGKTTLAKQVLQEVSHYHKHLFPIEVPISNSPNFHDIQEEVAQMLGFSLKEVEGKTLRANRLQNFLSNKKAVILLDDVWKMFDLSDFGFPLTKSDVGCCCKIIYTSRDKNLWSDEPKQEIFSLEILLDEEALNLFTRKVNLSHDDNDFHQKNEIAREIVDKCKGLPLALNTAGGALIKKATHQWVNMLNRLMKHNEQDRVVHEVLETSYDFLEKPNEKFVFLLCCLFREDVYIPVETLYRYAVGLQLFENTTDTEEISVSVHTIVDDLIIKSLLIKVKDNDDDYDDGYRVVKIHDVVRDVGISIGKQEHRFISLQLWKNGVEVLDKMEFQGGSKMELLRLDHSSSSYGTNIKISENLFKETDNFKVLDIVSYWNKISEFPLFSSKLKMLSLERLSLNMTTNISSIGHIKCLEILSLRNSRLKVLPNEISELTNLRLLDLNGCECFISYGVLSRLTNLQELYMWCCFNDWRLQKEDVDGVDNHAAGLEELNFLHRLWRLELEISNIEQVPRGVRLFSSSTLLKQFKIGIGKERNIGIENGKRLLILENVKDNNSFLPELGFLLEKDITDLYICADSGIWEKMSPKKFLSLKNIVLKQCGSLFPPSSMQTSELGRCLRRIKLYECNEMTHLCSTSISRNLTNLQVLVLGDCKMMEEVVSSCDKTEQLNKIEFNALKTLKLRYLPSLECFCKRINEIHFYKLKTLELEGLKQFIFPTKLEIPCLEELSMKLISNPNIEIFCSSSPSLQKLNIDNCDNFQYFDFSDSLVMKVITHLRNLTIKNCTKLKGVVGVTTGAEEQQRKSIEFPNLSTLELESLVELASFVIDVSNLGDKEEKSQSALFYQDDYLVSFPCLEDLQIKNLSKINYIIGRKREQLRGHHDHDDIEEGHGRKIQQPILLLLFPNLKTLKLGDLEELVSFVGVMNNNMDNNCKNQNALFHLDDDEVSFPCLEELRIRKLPKINYIVGWKEGGRQGEGHHRHDHKIFPVLRKLWLYGLINLIHMYEINQSGGLGGVLLFQNLTDLQVGECEKLRYLFSENIGRVAAKNLERLYIYNCPMMEVVMKNIEDDDDKAGVGGSHFFPLLKNLRLWNLSGLRSFCDVAYTWELPSLEHLRVLRCPKLEALSSGYLDSPRLESLQYNYREEVNVKDTWKGDVNAALCLRSFSDAAYTWELPLLRHRKKKNIERDKRE